MCHCHGDPDSFSVLTDVSATSVTVNERHALMRPNKRHLENAHHSVTQCFPDEQCTALHTGLWEICGQCKTDRWISESESEMVSDKVSHCSPQRDFGGEEDTCGVLVRSDREQPRPPGTVLKQCPCRASAGWWLVFVCVSRHRSEHKTESCHRSGNPVIFP